MSITEIREVTAILVLFGLPRDLTSTIIAHEAMHAWLRLTPSFPSELTPKLEEGLCQVISETYLKFMTDQRFLRGQDTMDDNAFHLLQAEESLRAYFRYQIETDQSVTYGDGYREAKTCVDALGLDIVLEFVRDNKKLPSL